MAWLYAIARHEVYGKARIKDPFAGPTEEHLALATEGDEPVFSDDDAARIHETLARLKAHHREILTLERGHG